MYIRGTASSTNGSSGAFTWRGPDNQVVTPGEDDVIIIKSIFMEQSNHTEFVRIYQDFDGDDTFDDGEQIWEYRSSSSNSRFALVTGIDFPVLGEFPLYFQIEDGAGVEIASVLVHANLQRREAWV